VTGSTAPPDSARQGVSLAPILAVNFVGTLGFSIVLPFLVFLVTRWGGNAVVYGVIGATYSACQLVGAPVLGRLSDVHGRRRILLLSQLGTLGSWAIFALAFALSERTLLSVDSAVLGQFDLKLPLLAVFLARACDGLTGGNVSVANAYLADITPEAERAPAYGKMAVAANIGFVLGPAIAGVLAETPARELTPVLTALAISVAASLLIAFRLPDSDPCALRADPEPSRAQKVFGQEPRPCVSIPREVSLLALLRLAGIPVLLSAQFLVMLGFNLYYVAFPIHAVSGLAWSVGETGIYFSVMSLLMALVQGPVLGRLSRHWPDRRLVAVGSILLAASFSLFVAEGVAVIYLGVVLLALGNGLMWPSMVSMLARAAGERQGAVQGLAGSSGAVASIIGLLAGGSLYTRLGPAVFVLSSLTILGTFVLALSLSRGQAPKASEPREG